MGEQLKKVHYFPGHMKKALGRLEPYVRSSDVVIEVCDARAPLSSRNPLLQELTKGKARCLIFSKNDMADPEVTTAWKEYFAKENLPSLAIDLKKEKLVNSLKVLFKKEIDEKRAKEEKRGMKKQPLRLLILGIPNVGKSTLINNLAERRAAISGNKPGVTRGEQWIKINEDFVTLDTPGILPMNYLDEEQAIHLAFLGSMKQEILPTDDLAMRLIGFLRQNYPKSLQKRYQIDDLSSFDDEKVLEAIGRKKGFLGSGGQIDLSKSALTLLKEYSDGLLGRYSLERP